MRTTRIMLRRLSCMLLVALQVAFYPAVGLAATDSGNTGTDSTASSTQAAAPATDPAADTPPPSATDPGSGGSTTPAADPPQTTGPAQPTGADSTTFKYNAATGLWENDYYTWDPVTHLTKPKSAQNYSYNPATGHWDTTEYVYDAPSGKYVPNVVSTTTPPAGAAKTASLADPAATGTGPGSTNNNLLAGNTGPNSNNNVNQNSNANSVFNGFYNAAISNTLTSSSRSGDALVQQNTQAGGALTGSASSIANLLNMLNSGWSPYSDGLQTFNANIYGNVTGDLTVDPANLPTQQMGVGNSNQNIQVNVADNGAINNDVKLTAQSGDATVASNTHGGDATSGSATAMANLINMINSAITAGKSFVGAINIYGDLNGDILLPPNLVNQLLASNTGPNSNNNVNDNKSTNIDANLDNTETIQNNINAKAGTGEATVANNTHAGDATSGNAKTNVTILNLTGKQIVGKDALLVFVNVLGRWVGMIVNAPAGTTAAALGTGVSSTNNLNSNQNLNADINESDKSLINNNIDVNAQSGDATVRDNTNAGNAKTGDANASVNVANIIGSNLNLSDWFGVLFINVFGSWEGSFGVNTSAGDVASTTGGRGAGPTTTATQTTAAATTPKVFGFIPKLTGNATTTSTTNGEASNQNTTSAVLSSDTNKPNTPASQSTTVSAKRNWTMPLIGLFIALVLLGSERFLSLRQQRLEQLVKAS